VSQSPHWQHCNSSSPILSSLPSFTHISPRALCPFPTSTAGSSPTNFTDSSNVIPDFSRSSAFCLLFTARRSYASAVLGVIILSVGLSIRLSVCYKTALWLIQRPTGDIFIPHDRAILLVFCYSTVVGGRRPLHLKWAIEVTHLPSKIAHVDRFIFFIPIRQVGRPPVGSCIVKVRCRNEHFDP